MVSQYNLLNKHTLSILTNSFALRPNDTTFLMDTSKGTLFSHILNQIPELEQEGWTMNKYRPKRLFMADFAHMKFRSDKYEAVKLLKLNSKMKDHCYFLNRENFMLVTEPVVVPETKQESDVLLDEKEKEKETPDQKDNTEIKIEKPDQKEEKGNTTESPDQKPGPGNIQTENLVQETDQNKDNDNNDLESKTPTQPKEDSIKKPETEKFAVQNNKTETIIEKKFPDPEQLKPFFKLDNVILNCQSHLPSLIERLLPFMNPNCKLVIYSRYTSVVNEVYDYLKRSKSFAMIQMGDYLIRKFQVFNMRTRPEMRAPLNDGCILTAYKVVIPENTAEKAVN